jgi:hypothetical protein
MSMCNTSGPPDGAHEKQSIQALKWAQGYFKLPNGRAFSGQSHDYKRHGITPLFAPVPPCGIA